MQNYSSKNTSVNSGKLPAIYGKVDFDTCHQSMHPVVLDYGCGRFSNAQFYVNTFGWCWFGLDKYWKPDDENRVALNLLKDHRQDCTICSNLLNVIDDEEEIQTIVNRILKSSEDFSELYAIPFFITVYEGNKSGIGKVSKNDCWQRNERLKEYQKYFKHAKSPVYQVHGVITNRPDCLLGVNPDRCKPFAGF